MCQSFLTAILWAILMIRTSTKLCTLQRPLTCFTVVASCHSISAPATRSLHKIAAEGSWVHSSSTLWQKCWGPNCRSKVKGLSTSTTAIALPWRIHTGAGNFILSNILVTVTKKRDSCTFFQWVCWVLQDFCYDQELCLLFGHCLPKTYMVRSKFRTEVCLPCGFYLP